MRIAAAAAAKGNAGPLSFPFALLSTLLKQRLDLILSRRLSANYSAYLDNIFWLASERGLRLAFALFAGDYVAQYLGPDRFGLLGYAQGIVGMALTVTSLESMTS